MARWRNHEHTAEAVDRDFGPMVDGTEPAENHLVLLNGAPVGLIQYSVFADYPEYIEELSGVLPVPAGAVSVDYFPAEPAAVGRGVGTAMLTAFAEHIWSNHPEASCIIVPVNSANQASWRALLAAGFRLVAQGDLQPDNPVDDPSHEILRLDRSMPAPAAGPKRKAAALNAPLCMNFPLTPTMMDSPGWAMPERN